MPRATKSPGLEFENQVRQSLKRIGFHDINGGPAFRVGDRQIDACGGYDDLMLVAECTQSEGTASIHDLISEVKGKQPDIRRGFRQSETHRNYQRFEFAIITRNIDYTPGDLEIAARSPKVHLINVRDITYYETLAHDIGAQGALFHFLGDLGVEPRNLDVPRVPAFKVRLGDYPTYLFWCEPYELLKAAYVARRASGRDRYYQRIVSPSRLSQIKKFIEQRAGLFPNNIVIAFDQDKRPAFRPKPPYDDSWPANLEYGELVFPKSYRSCWVIDGQHRLYAFGKVTRNPSTQKVAVMAFERLPLPRQAKFFIEINHEQKKVPDDLIWDLEGEMNPTSPRGQIANCVKKLNGIAPLLGAISVPSVGERKRGQLKMSGVCQDLSDTGLLSDRTPHMMQSQRNPLIHSVPDNQKPDRVANAIANFLNTLKTSAPGYLWNGVFLRPGGITVALNVYERALIRAERTPTAEQLAQYTQALAQIVGEMVPSESAVSRFIREQLTSYAQRRQLSSEILVGMGEKLQDDHFAWHPSEAVEPFDRRVFNFERRLAEFVTERLGIHDLTGLRQKAPPAVWQRVAERLDRERRTQQDFPVHMGLTLGETKEIIERRDNSQTMMPIFTDPVDGFGDEQAVLAALSGILRVRTPLAHGRSGGNRRLAIAYLDTFERIIGH